MAVEKQDTEGIVPRGSTNNIKVTFKYGRAITAIIQRFGTQLLSS